ncbi:MAG: type II secretion system F family protein [Patulibacter sp.]|nr:type II secretion system F family protein [Patulibacter sp.]
MTVIVLVGIASGALAGAAIALLVAEWAGRGARASSGPDRGSRVLRVARWAGPVVRRLAPTPTDAARRIDAAGLSPTVRPSDLRAVRGAAIVVGLGAGVVAMPAVGGGGLLLVVAVPAALGLVPDLVLRRRTTRRAAAMLRALPDTIDLLRIALRSGRSVPDALARVGAHHHGELGAELRRTAGEVRIGVPVDVALTGLRRRCPAEGAAELAALLRRAHHQGSPVGDGLQALADDLRDRRARAAIDRAARAAPKIQLVVALLLVPAAMLLIAAALLQLRAG